MKRRGRNHIKSRKSKKHARDKQSRISETFILFHKLFHKLYYKTNVLTILEKDYPEVSITFDRGKPTRVNISGPSHKLHAARAFLDSELDRLTGPLRSSGKKRRRPRNRRGRNSREKRRSRSRESSSRGHHHFGSTYRNVVPFSRKSQHDDPYIAGEKRRARSNSEYMSFDQEIKESELDYSPCNLSEADNYFNEEENVFPEQQEEHSQAISTTATIMATTNANHFERNNSHHYPPHTYSQLTDRFLTPNLQQKQLQQVQETQFSNNAMGNHHQNFRNNVNMNMKNTNYNNTNNANVPLYPPPPFSSFQNSILTNKNIIKNHSNTNIHQMTNIVNNTDNNINSTSNSCNYHSFVHNAIDHIDKNLNIDLSDFPSCDEWDDEIIDVNTQQHQAHIHPNSSPTSAVWSF